MKNRDKFHKRPPNKPHQRPPLQTLEGELELKGNVGFVLSEQAGEPDVMVQGPSLKMALSRDRVKVRVFPSFKGERRRGEIVEVLKRHRQTLVGVFKKTEREALLQPE